MPLTSAEAEPVTPVPPAQPSPGEPTAARGPTATPPLGWRTDLLVAAGYLLGAVYVMIHLLVHPATRMVRSGAQEQQFSEWSLLHGANVVSRFDPLLTSTRPDGSGPVDMLAAHGFPGLSVPLAPLTLLIGPARTFAVAVTLCLAGTGYAWYHVLSRHLLRHRSAAVIAGLLGGFAPAMVAHAQGDLAPVAQFLVPFLIWRATRLREPGRAVANGVVLGLLAAWQAFLDEQLLLLVALGGLVFLVAYAIFQAAQEKPSWARVGRPVLAFLRGFGVTAAVAAILLAYPLWTQISGGPHPVLPHPDRDGVDLLSYAAFATPSMATWPVGTLHHALVFTEQNTFYGWPLLILLVGSVWWVRGTTVRAVAATVAVLAALSLGREVMVNRTPLHVPGPWRWVGDLPLLRSVPAVDVALAVLPLVVLLFALFADWGITMVRREADRFTTLAWYGLLLAVLLPIAPTPVSAVPLVGPAWRTVTLAETRT
jgi:hypothetical protein